MKGDRSHCCRQGPQSGWQFCAFGQSTELERNEGTRGKIHSAVELVFRNTEFYDCCFFYFTASQYYDVKYYSETVSGIIAQISQHQPCFCLKFCPSEQPEDVPYTLVLPACVTAIGSNRRNNNSWDYTIVFEEAISEKQDATRIEQKQEDPIL